MRSNKAIVNKVIAAFNPKLTVREIADDLEMPASVVRPILNRRGLKAAKSLEQAKFVPLTKEQRKKIDELASNELTPSQLAVLVGSTRDKVYQQLFRKGLPYKICRGKQVTEPEVFSWEWAEGVDHLFKQA